MTKGINISKGYKQTKVGMIPEDWIVQRIQDVCSSKGEYGINAAAVDYSEMLPTYIRITDIDDDGKFIRSGKKSVQSDESSKFYLEKGDILFVRTGATVGKTYLYHENDGQLVFAGFLIRFKIDHKECIPYYLWSYTKTKKYWDWVKMISVRSGQPGINSREYSSFEIPLPSLPEQQKIATILTTWDKSISTTQSIVDELKLRNKGLAQQLLTGKKRLKGFDGEWQNMKIEKVLIESKKPSKKPDPARRISVKLNLKGIEKRGERGAEAKGSTAYFIRKAGQFIYGRQNLHKGALGIIPSELDGFESTQDIPAFDFTEMADPNWFLFFISRESFYTQLENISTGTGSKRIHPKNLFKITISAPYLDEQKAIVSVLSKADKELKLYQKKLTTLKEQKKGVMQKLLTGEIRVTV